MYLFVFQAQALVINRIAVITLQCDALLQGGHPIYWVQHILYYSTLLFLLHG